MLDIKYSLYYNIMIDTIISNVPAFHVEREEIDSPEKFLFINF